MTYRTEKRNGDFYFVSEDGQTNEVFETFERLIELVESKEITAKNKFEMLSELNDDDDFLKKMKDSFGVTKEMFKEYITEFLEPCVEAEESEDGIILKMREDGNSGKFYTANGISIDFFCKDEARIILNIFTKNNLTTKEIGRKKMKELPNSFPKELPEIERIKRSLKILKSLSFFRAK